MARAKKQKSKKAKKQKSKKAKKAIGRMQEQIGWAAIQSLGCSEINQWMMKQALWKQIAVGLQRNDAAWA